VDGPVSQTVDVGDEAVLHCAAVTDPAEPLTVEWRQDDVPIDFETTSHLRYDSTNHSLIILHAAVTDTAVYTCHAGNGLDEVQSAPATLTVRGLLYVHVVLVTFAACVILMHYLQFIM